jgi:hypothetical protein
MSASPPKADMCGALAYVCFGPKADIGDRIEPQGCDFCISKHGPMTCPYFREHKVDGQKESGEECKTNVSYEDESLSHIRPVRLMSSVKTWALSLRNYQMFQ